MDFSMQYFMHLQRAAKYDFIPLDFYQFTKLVREIHGVKKCSCV